MDTFGAFLKTPSGHEVLVDEDVAEEFEGKSVTIGSHGYAQIYVDGKVLLLHRWILGLKVGDKRVSDHINGDPLDNRRENLRAVDGTTSNYNRRVKGSGAVETRYGRWEARPWHKGKEHYAGVFDTREEAEEAVDRWRAEQGIVHLRFQDG